MNYMFRSCQKLKSLDLKQFNTPNLQYMEQLFCNCNSLEYLDVTNFDTSKIQDMS